MYACPENLREKRGWKLGDRILAWSRCRSIYQALESGMLLDSSIDETPSLSKVSKKLFEYLQVALFVDPFGNVISPFAKPSAPGFADIDHIFPLSLGGINSHANKVEELKSLPKERTNLVMLQWIANRNIKVDFPLQFIPPAKLQTGFSVGFFWGQFKSTVKKERIIPLLLGFDPLESQEPPAIDFWPEKPEDIKTAGLCSLKSMWKNLYHLAELEPTSEDEEDA